MHKLIHRGLIKELHSVGGHWHGARYLTTLKGHVFIHFTDIRDSCSIHTRICLTMKEWKSAYIFPEHLTKVYFLVALVTLSLLEHSLPMA